MTHYSQTAGRVQGVLLALAIVVLSAFTTSDAKENARHPGTVAPPAAAGPASVSTLEIYGPSGVVACGQTVTLTVKDCYGCCLHWFYNGTYTVTNTGSFTFVADGSITDISVVKYLDCILCGTMTGSGSTTIYYASTCP